jgi:hypothetical protein
MNDWTVIVHTLGDLAYLAAAIIALIDARADRHDK